MRTRRTAVDVVAFLFLAALVLLVWPSRFGGDTTFVLVRGESMEPRLNGGDLAIVRSAEDYAVGDVVAYRIPDGQTAGRMVIHRIVDRSGGRFVMRGDNRATNDQWMQSSADVTGRVVFTVPSAGGLLGSLLPWASLTLVGGGLALLMRRRPGADSVIGLDWPPPTVVTAPESWGAPSGVGR